MKEYTELCRTWANRCVQRTSSPRPMEASCPRRRDAGAQFARMKSRFSTATFYRRCFLAIADHDCNESRCHAGSSGDTIACAHADERGKTKTRGGCTEHTTQGVDCVQQAATAFYSVDAGESLTESRKRCAQA